jgi:hypothetical protein
MTCASLRQRILAVAAGASADADVTRHLGECAACHALLERERALLSRIDGALLEGLAVSPAPDFLPRVRERIETERTQSRLWSWRWIPAGLAAAAAVGVALSYWRGTPETNLPTSGLSPTREEAVAANASPSVVPADPAREATRPPVPRAGTSRESASAGAGDQRRRSAPERAAAARDVPEVLVPTSDEASLRQFLRALRSEPRMAQALSPPPEPAELQDLSIVALEVKPLAQER